MRSFTPIILVLISIGLFYLYIHPHYGTVRALLEERSQYADALNRIQEVKDLRNNLEGQYASIPGAQLARIERLLPQRVNTVGLATDIDALGGTRGITLRNIRVTEERVDNSATVSSAPAKPYRSTTINFSVTATYKDFVAFLRDIEQSLQLIDVKSIIFRSVTAQTNLYQFDVSMETYWIE